MIRLAPELKEVLTDADKILALDSDLKFLLELPDDRVTGLLAGIAPPTPRQRPVGAPPKVGAVGDGCPGALWRRRDSENDVDR